MKKILVFLLVVVVAAGVAGFVLPTKYVLARSVTIQAQPDRVHEYVNDLTRWPQWMPWEEQDPTVKTTLGSTTQGVGASQSWTGDSGDGEITVTASDPDTGIAYDMAFIDGESRLPSTGTVSYTKRDGGTEVTWSMEGDMGPAMPRFMAGWVTLMVKRHINESFDAGLARLKACVEQK